MPRHTVPTRSACCLTRSVCYIAGLAPAAVSSVACDTTGLAPTEETCDLTGLAPSSTKCYLTGRAPLVTGLLSYGACPARGTESGARHSIPGFDAIGTSSEMAGVSTARYTFGARLGHGVFNFLAAMSRAASGLHCVAGQVYAPRRMLKLLLNATGSHHAFTCTFVRCRVDTRPK